MQLTEIDTEALDLVRLYRAQGDKVTQLRLANGSGHESVRRQARMADLTARELREKFDLDADELAEQLEAEETIAEIEGYAASTGRIAAFSLALRSVRAVTVLKHDLGAVGQFAELPLGTRQPSSVPVSRSAALETLLGLGALDVNRTQEHRVTTLTRYHRVVLTPLGEALLERFEQ